MLITKHTDGMRRNDIINIGVWVALLLGIGICGLLINFKPLILGTHYKVTNGTIVQKFPNNHLGIHFTYEVDGRTFEGDGYAGQINRAFDEIQLGDTVTVFYDKQSPSSSTLEVPNVLSVQRIGQIVAVALIFSVLGMCILHRYQLLPYCSTFAKCRVQQQRQP
jgi:ABC-type antimicrobial peptide transport system permease subunit